MGSDIFEKVNGFVKEGETNQARYDQYYRHHKNRFYVSYGTFTSKSYDGGHQGMRCGFSFFIILY